MRIAIRSKSFRGEAVLGPIEVAIGAGETVALLGPSGIGKTTLIRLVAGLDSKFDGRIEGAGRVAIAFQEPRLLPWRSVRENITLATRIADSEADTLLAEVGLGGRGEAFPAELSLGQQRRVALARALALRPDTLLLDEPFVSLDAFAAGRMQDLLADLLSDHPMRTILVTHAPAEAARLADRVLRLGGRPARIVADERLERPRAERDAAWIETVAARLAGLHRPAPSAIG